MTEVIRIAVCDDEEQVRMHTQKLLNEYENQEVVCHVYENGEALLAAGADYDIILLDIDMDGINGIETAKQIREKDKKVKLIYVTNYSDYTIFAFAVHAFAYLLKPIKKEELFAQLDEAVSYGEKITQKELEFTAKEGILRICPTDILYFEYQDREVLLYTKEQVWHIKARIAEIAQRMKSYDFVIPHKSFVVNLYGVQNIRGYDIILTDGRYIPLSQKKSAEFRRTLNQYLAKEKGLRE